MQPTGLYREDNHCYCLPSWMEGDYVWFPDAHRRIRRRPIHTADGSKHIYIMYRGQSYIVTN